MSDIPAMIITPMVVLLLLGIYIDKLMNFSTPYFTIIGFLLGVFTGFWSVYKKYGT